MEGTQALGIFHRYNQVVASHLYKLNSHDHFIIFNSLSFPPSNHLSYLPFLLSAFRVLKLVILAKKDEPSLPDLVPLRFGGSSSGARKGVQAPSRPVSA